jgi:ElaB/YqjD/DUF883 family membrane-anchored ribosome-binding protein
MTQPLPILEERAAAQRRQIHNTVGELRSTVKYRLDPRRNAREHIWTALGVAALLGLVAGFMFTGMFTRR